MISTMGALPFPLSLLATLRIDGVRTAVVSKENKPGSLVSEGLPLGWELVDARRVASTSLVDSSEEDLEGRIDFWEGAKETDGRCFEVGNAACMWDDERLREPRP